jgi:RHS repeat-associated protein
VLVSGSTTATAAYASYFYTKDHLGSVRELTDSTGTVRARYDYEVWGARSANKITAANAAPGKPPVQTEMGFTGYRLHAATGQYLSPTRLYSPQLGRFTSQDPIGIDGGLNLYAYVSNDPINYLDPLGLADIKVNGEIWRTPMKGDAGHVHVFNGVDQGPHMHGPKGAKFFRILGCYWTDTESGRGRPNPS